MTVAEYQQAQKDIAEIKAQIAQLRDVVAKGVPAIRDVYGVDQAEPTTNAPIPPMMSAHEQAGTPNVNPFQDSFTPNTNTMSMQEIAGQVAPKADQPLLERIGRGAANIPVGMAAMAEQATSDPAGFAKGTGEYLNTWAKRLNPNQFDPSAIQARTEFGQQLATDPVGTGLDVLGVAGTALGLPALGGKIKGFKSIKEAKAAIKDIGKPKVDVPEVVQEPIRSEMPVEQPTSAAEVVGKAKNAPITVDEMNINKQPITNEQVVTNNQPKAGLELNKSGWATKRVMVEKSLSRRHVAGDKKLDALDLADELADKGADISDDGYVTLYHRTTKSGADAIIKSGKMVGREDRQFFGTSPTGQIEGYGDAVIVVKLPVEKLELNDVFSNEAHVTLRGQSVKINAAKWGEPTTATEVVAKASPNAVTKDVKTLTPDELTAAQTRLREKFKPMDEAIDSRAGKISTEQPTATVQDAGATPAQSSKQPVSRTKKSEAQLESEMNQVIAESQQRANRGKNDVIATIGDYEFAYIKDNEGRYGIGARRVGSSGPFESAGYGFSHNRESLNDRFAQKEAYSQTQKMTVYDENLKKKVEDVELGNKKREEQLERERQERRASELDDAKQRDDIVSRYGKHSYKKGMIRRTGPDGVTEVEGMVSGNLGYWVDPDAKKSLGLKRPFIITHNPSGLRVAAAATKEEANVIIGRLKEIGDWAEADPKKLPYLVQGAKIVQDPYRSLTQPDLAAKYGKPTTAEAVVKKAGEKKPVTVKQAASEIKQEAATTKLTDKSFKSQMKSEIEAALKDAPDRPQELQDMIDSYNYADEKRGGMSWERKEESLKAQRENINDLRKKLDIKTVTIEIPDDGTFTVEHTKQALQELNKRLGQNIETKVRQETSTPRGGDRGLQEATIGGYNVQVFGDQSSIRPSGTKGISTIKVDYRNDPVLKKLGVVSNDHYLIEESALTKHPKQILIKDKALDEAKTKEFISGLDKIKFDDNSANEIVAYNDGLNNKVIFDNGELSVGFSGEYIEFFKSNVKNFSLRLSGETTPAAIMSGDKRVGVLMPLRTEGQIAITRPTPTELHSGVNPFKIIDDYMTKRKLVNPFGTPEHVLSGKGIVGLFRKAQEAIRNETKARGESLQGTLKGIQRGSAEDSKLYRRLDDPKAILNEREQVVREYLDNFLEEVNKHRIARGQEPVKRRKGYITHLVDEVERQSREYGDTPMPKRFRFQFELAREGNASHRVSAIEALEVYTKAALKDIYIGDALAETVPKIEAMGDRPLIFKKSVTSPDGKVTNQSFYQFSDAPIITERGYAEAFIKGQMNVPTVGQRIMEKMFDIKPNTSQHAAMAVTARFYQSLLGLAVDSGVKNLTQGINTLAELGATPTLGGYAKMATPKGLKLARAEHLLEDFNPLLMEGADLPFKTKTARAIGKGISATLNAPMKVAEFINRGAAFHAAYDVYIKKGMSLEQAHEAARAAVRKTQFSYAKIDTSPALRGPFARIFSQFFSYPLKQSEMMYKWATKPGEQGKLIRYFLYTGMAVVGAKYNGIDLSGVFFDPIRMVDPNSKEGVQLPGTDKRVTFDASKLGKSGYTPQGFAPSISIPADFIKSQMSDDESTREYGREKALTNIIPGGRYGKKVYDVITESDEKGKRDRLTRENTDKDKVLKLLGFRGTEREAESSRRESVVEVEKKYYATRQKLIDLKISGDMDEFNKIRDEFRAQYPFLYGRLMKGFNDAVKEERKKKGMTTDERFFDNSLRKQIERNL